MTCAPSAAASRAASSCLSIIASLVPAQSVCSRAAFTVVDMASLPQSSVQPSCRYVSTAGACLFGIVARRGAVRFN